MVRVVVRFVMARVTSGAVVLPVASKMRVLSLSIGGATYVAVVARVPQMKGVADVAAGGGGVLGAVVVRVVSATVACHKWCTG